MRESDTWTSLKQSGNSGDKQVYMWFFGFQVTETNLK